MLNGTKERRMAAEPAPQGDRRLLSLAPGDDVLVVTERIAAGAAYVVAGETFSAASELGLGHKVAARDIAEGAKVLKYGAPIGRARRAILRGEHVHVHNLASDYTPTYLPPEPAT